MLGAWSGKSRSARSLIDSRSGVDRMLQSSARDTAKIHQIGTSSQDSWRRRAPGASRKYALLLIPALGCVVLALLWVVIIARLTTERENVTRDSQAEAALLSAALEQHTLKSIRQVDQITRFVKYEYEKSPQTFDLDRVVETSVAPSDTLVQVSMIDENGKFYANTTAAQLPKMDLSDREHFLVHKQSSEDFLYISKPVIGRFSKQWTLQVTRRLNHPNGSFAGVVVVSEDPAYFTNDYYNDVVLGHNGMIAVLNDDGTILSRRSGNAEAVPTTTKVNGSVTAARYPEEKRTTGLYADPIDGINRFVSYRHIEGYPLGVLVGLSESDELADYNHTRSIYLLMASFISLAMIGFFGVATGLIDKLLVRERDMVKLVETDLLTGLPNRFRTLKILHQEVTENNCVGKLALLFIDLDNFKTVNDTLGHNAGDIVLQTTAQRLTQSIGNRGMLARIGGDEFVVVVQSDDIESSAVEMASIIEETLQQPCDVRGSSFVLRASVGIALYSSITENEIDLLKKADLAMYSAKNAGKNCYQFYSPQLAHKADHLMRWERQLRIALAERQLLLVYQPKINLATRHITGFEALIRWNHPQQGLIAAVEFISIAESNGLIVPMGDFVLEQACAQLRQWQHAGHSNLSMAVNISPMQFWRGDIVGAVSRCLHEYHIPAHLLELEITETAMMDHTDLVAEKIAALKKLGVRIALDDFGTGYSSLSFLNRFSVDTLKVDKSFVHAIPGDRHVCVMVAGVIRLAQSLGLTVVVEGTETQEQIDWLSKLGDIDAQGYLFSRPVPAAEVSALIAQYGLEQRLLVG